MCGIAGALIKSGSGLHLTQQLRSFSELLKHRGPDGEGFLVVSDKTSTSYSGTHQTFKNPHALPYLPVEPLPDHLYDAKIGFVHRRLSIIDLSENAHQPMCTSNQSVWITYNGEIYNYLELKEELKQLGFSFVSESDTEVILNAYTAWGPSCVGRFNGMWSFCIYDSVKQILFASRDRLGVKPFYYTNQPGFFAFASEQKALVKSGLTTSETNESALHNYLINGLLETTTTNFFKQIQELWPGTNLIYNLKNDSLSLKEFYHIRENVSNLNDSLNDAELIEKIKISLKNSIELRLRSDVEVGTCLSGGIDSSSIAVSIAEITRQPFYCFTSVFGDHKLSEERFANLVAEKTGAKHKKIEPTLDGLISELDTLIYSQDIPIWDTSTYAQYKVMELAGQNGIKVVLDGQGADELFGGYHHHFLATWNHFFSSGKYLDAIKNIQASHKTITHPFAFFVKERIKQNIYFRKNELKLLFQGDFIQSFPIINPSRQFNDLNEQLLHDIYTTRLKSFLKCEDRCGMWHSVESRVPFSDDINLINLMFSFNGNRKIKHGVSKYLLREAMKDKLPAQIYNRHDKKGFDTPMNKWLKAMLPKMKEEILDSGLNFINKNKLLKSNPEDFHLNKILFKLFVYCRWKKMFAN